MRPRTGDKRERILAAAVKVFAEKGFYCARVSDVAREAGVADGTIYLYFASKEELLRGLFEEHMRRIIDEVRGLVAEGGTPADKLSRVFSAYVRFAEENPDLAEVLTVELRESGKFMNEFAGPRFGDFLRVIEEIVLEGQEQGRFQRHLSARTVTRAMFGALDEICLAWVMSKRKWNLKRSGKELLEVFLGGLLSPEARAGADAVAPSQGEPSPRAAGHPSETSVNPPPWRNA